MQSSDLREAADPETKRRLARGADVFSSSDRPIVNTRFGLLPTELAAARVADNPTCFRSFYQDRRYSSARNWVSERPELYAPTFPLVRTNNHRLWRFFENRRWRAEPLQAEKADIVETGARVCI
jgi:hypothetical protein